MDQDEGVQEQLTNDERLVQKAQEWYNAHATDEKLRGTPQLRFVGDLLGVVGRLRTENDILSKKST